MAWTLIGVVGLDATAGEVAVGRVVADLVGGYLPLLITTITPADPNPLGFALCSLIDDAFIRPFPSQKYYPQSQPQIIQLGPGIESTVAGTIYMQPRRYNRQWLTGGIPGKSWFIRVDAYSAAESPLPRFIPAGLRFGAADLVPIAGTGAPDVSLPLKVNG